MKSDGTGLDNLRLEDNYYGIWGTPAIRVLQTDKLWDKLHQQADELSRELRPLDHVELLLNYLDTLIATATRRIETSEKGKPIVVYVPYYDELVNRVTDEHPTLVKGLTTKLVELLQLSEANIILIAGAIKADDLPVE